MDSKKFISNLDEATFRFERLLEVWIATNAPPTPKPGRLLRAVPIRVTLVEFLLIDSRRTFVNYGRKGTMVEIARRSVRNQAPRSLDKHSRSLNTWAADFTGILLERKVCPRTKIPILVSALMGRPCVTSHDLTLHCDITAATARSWLRRLARHQLAWRYSIGNTDYHLVLSSLQLLADAAAVADVEISNANSLTGAGSPPPPVQLEFPAMYGREGYIPVVARNMRR